MEQTDSDCTLLFVYGTLRRKCSHPMAELLAQKSQVVGVGSVQGRLFDLGEFPAMLAAESADDLVRGELVELSDAPATLSELDAYEGYACEDRPGLFKRQQITVTLDDSREVTAWAYLYKGPLANAVRIDSGDFVMYLQNRV